MSEQFDVEAVVLGEISTEQALTGGTSSGRVFARLTISTAHVALLSFVNTEIDRGTEEADLLIALGRWMIQVHASVAAQFIAPEGAAMMADLFKDQVESGYAPHMQLSRQWVAEQARDGTA
jgi:hypothetical protein